MTISLSCEITMSKDQDKAWLYQPHLIKKLEKKFAEEVSGLAKFKTPGTPRGNILRDVDNTVDKEKHARFRSGVGTLLYLVKHTRPDIANSVRELSKAMDGPNPAAYKELLHTIKYVLDTKDLALKMFINVEVKDGAVVWRVVVFSDSDWADDPETRISITGYIIYFMGVAICWKSKSQKGVTLSSSEAELVALSEAVKEVRFIHQVLTSIGIEVETPIVVRVDNIGAIFMSNSVAISNATKHVDIRSRFVVQYVMNGTVKVIFVRSENNDSDICTKNLVSRLHHKHAEKVVVVKGTEEYPYGEVKSQDPIQVG